MVNIFKSSSKGKSKDHSLASSSGLIAAAHSSNPENLSSPPVASTAVNTAPIPSIPAADLDLDVTDGPYGVQTISNPVDADIDIWLVHGLTGNRDSTWRHKNGTFTPDLLRTRFPSARIITYGYDANVVGIWKNASGEGLRGHGKGLAYAVADSRSGDGDGGTSPRYRPLFFIAHSLGGLVTEQALLVSLEPGDPRLRGVAASTAGVIFMGTPHSGSYLAWWGMKLAQLLNQLRRTNREILSVLEQESTVLSGVEELFQRHLTTPDGALRHVRIFCFYETVAVHVVGYVVPRASATMLPHPNCGIDANHMDMTRFTSVNDAGFVRVKGVLEDWIKRAKDEPEHEASKKPGDAISTSGPTLTFNSSSIRAGVFQHGTGNAGRDIIYGNVTNQSAGRDWVNKDRHIQRPGKNWGALDADQSNNDN